MPYFQDHRLSVAAMIVHRDAVLSLLMMQVGSHTVPSGSEADPRKLERNSCRSQREDSGRTSRNDADKWTRIFTRVRQKCTTFADHSVYKPLSHHHHHHHGEPYPRHLSRWMHNLMHISTRYSECNLPHRDTMHNGRTESYSSRRRCSCAQTSMVCCGGWTEHPTTCSPVHRKHTLRQTANLLGRDQHNPGDLLSMA
jgi:hypothetical protein